MKVLTAQALVQPQLSVRGGRAAVAFYRAAFGAVEEYRAGGSDDSETIVCQLSVGNASFWVTDESPPHGKFSPRSLGGSSARMLLITEDPQSVIDRAVAAGAVQVYPASEAHEWLLGRVEDPFGHHWEIGKPLVPWPPVRHAHAVPEPTFDFEGIFGEDYLYFYAESLRERAAAEAGLIWRLLELEPGMEVLDLACGHGRIASALAARGCLVTGLDASPLFLDLARSDADASGIAVSYIQGDMRELPWTARFDRVINWFTAFGYFDDAGNQQVISEVVRALKPDGLFALEMNNRDGVIRRFQPASVHERDGNLLIDRHEFEPLTGRMVTERTTIRDGRIRRVPFFVRMYTFTELRDCLLDAGFASVDGYDEDGNPLTIHSRRMVTVAHR